MGFLGPVMVSVSGTSLNELDRNRLQHPAVGGVLLFLRNYSSKKKLVELLQEMRACRAGLVVAVDHEGGRVQRFKTGFTLLPPMGEVGDLYRKSADEGKNMAKKCGAVLARELSEVGIDFSFTPVLDLATYETGVIGDRAFHSDPKAVVELGGALLEGLHAESMIGVGKHFPGHGSVETDTHLQKVVDHRSYQDIWNQDMVPFATLAGRLDAIMVAHVRYSAVDDCPASLSHFWITQKLCSELRFRGIVFSDDLSMQAVSRANTVPLKEALAAGCDMAIISSPKHADLALQSLSKNEIESYGQRFGRKWERVARLATEPLV